MSGRGQLDSMSVVPVSFCLPSVLLAHTGISLPMQHAECDIAVTKDRELILCHDANFKRLALDPSAARATAPIGDLTVGQLAGLPLKSGSTAPRLVDVLRSCRAIGGPARMVVEIKPENPEAVQVLADMHTADPNLFDTVSVVMSFDLEMAQQSASLMTERFAGVSLDARPAVLYLRATEDYYGPLLSLSALDTAIVDKYLSGTDEAKPAPLDGLYIQFEQGMLTSGDPVAENLKTLCQRCVVGVWGVPEEQDTVGVAQQLVDLGVSFVNTDMPSSFV